MGGVYASAEPCLAAKREVFKLAERFAARVGFLPGDRIEPVIERLGGRLEYLSATDSFLATDGSVFVDGPNDFRIIVSALTTPERDRFTIAHEFGHYVLHSDEGRKRIQAARFGSGRVEWEANWFAAAFLMPEADFRATCTRFSSNPLAVAARYLVSPKAAEVRMSDLQIG